MAAKPNHAVALELLAQLQAKIAEADEGLAYDASGEYEPDSDLPPNVVAGRLSDVVLGMTALWAWAAEEGLLYASPPSEATTGPVGFEQLALHLAMASAAIRRTVGVPDGAGGRAALGIAAAIDQSALALKGLAGSDGTANTLPALLRRSVK